MQALDECNFACGILFVDLEKAFDTVDHNILLKKLGHYGVRGISSKWFESYLTDQKQFASINGFNSDISTITSGVSQGSVLGPLLFLIYINELNVAIKHCKVHHFADNTNLLNINISPKHLNKFIYIDLKNLTKWLNVNKISLKLMSTIFIKFLFFYQMITPFKNYEKNFLFHLRSSFHPQDIQFLYFCPSLFFYLWAIALEDDQR